MLLVYNTYNLRTIPHLQKLSEKEREEIEILSKIFPFRTNNYVVNELIDWDNYPNDPVFRLNFPSRQMLKPAHFEKISTLYRKENSEPDLKNAVEDIWNDLNPHPAGQLNLNVPCLNGRKLAGLQHKYRETVLFFPTQGQTCHAYCTFCFRWPQFIGKKELKFARKETGLLIEYLKQNKQVTDLLITGGDPMVMSANHLACHIDAILEARIPHLKSIRIGTKALSYWPYRFVSDPDTPELLKLFKKIVRAGKNLSIMAHLSHPVELSTKAFRKAVRNLLKTGAQIRSQSPVLDRINANANIWAKMWKDQVNQGIIPYYMFIARDTGAQKYFRVALHETWKIFRDAYSQVSGLCRTVRGPSMSCGPGKIQISGVSRLGDDKVFVLNFIQSRLPSWTGKPFFARYHENAFWLNDLKPLPGEKEFFYENEYRKLIDRGIHTINMEPVSSYNSLPLCS